MSEEVHHGMARTFENVIGRNVAALAALREALDLSHELLDIILSTLETHRVCGDEVAALYQRVCHGNPREFVRLMLEPPDNLGELARGAAGRRQ